MLKEIKTQIKEEIKNYGTAMAEWFKKCPNTAGILFTCFGLCVYLYVAATVKNKVWDLVDKD